MSTLSLTSVILGCGSPSYCLYSRSYRASSAFSLLPVSYSFTTCVLRWIQAPVAANPTRSATNAAVRPGVSRRAASLSLSLMGLSVPRIQKRLETRTSAAARNPQ